MTEINAQQNTEDRQDTADPNTVGACEKSDVSRESISAQTDASRNEEDGSGEKDNVGAAKPKRGKLINALKVFGFLLLILAVNAAMYFGGRPDIPGALHSYRTYQLNRVFGERRNSIDVVYVGHSGVHCGVSAMEIYDDYGIAGYSLSQPLMLPWESYETVVDLLEEQDLKVIALEANAFFYDNFGNFFNSYAKRFTLSAFPFYESHLYWRDGFKRSARDPYKNFPFYSETEPYNGVIDRSLPSDGVYKMNAKHKEYFVKFVELCNSRGIKLALFELPVVKYWSWDRHNCIVELCREYDLEFLDMNVGDAAERADIDFKRDFIDAGDHLNYYGAIKASRVLGEWLKAECGDSLPYRKGTPDYKDWDEDLKEYREKAETMPDREQDKEGTTDVA